LFNCRCCLSKFVARNATRYGCGQLFKPAYGFAHGGERLSIPSLGFPIIRAFANLQGNRAAGRGRRAALQIVSLCVLSICRKIERLCSKKRRDNPTAPVTPEERNIMTLLFKVILKLLEELHQQLERSPDSFIDSDIVSECSYMLRDVQERQTALQARLKPITSHSSDSRFTETEQLQMELKGMATIPEEKEQQ
jgi:hypothetical protein